jgi:lipopolysaccharide export system ATP-binding protein
LADLFSYFRRRRSAPNRRRNGGLVADTEAIDLASIGGVIDSVYLDIASVPAPVERTRARTAPQRPAAIPSASSPSIAPPVAPPSAVLRPPQFRAPRPPVPQNGARSELRNEARNEVRNEFRNGPDPATRPRRRADGNGATGGDSKALLAVHSVEKTFVGNKVVKGVSLYVRKGEAVGLLGPNGAGKTTVFYMITGLIKADRGRVELDGCDVTRLPMYQRARLGIGYLPQEASIFRGLTVEDNIRAVLEVVEPSAKRRAHDLDALLEEFNIARLRKTPAIALSGGERRRCEIARALATRPNYMLLDEPFAGIDPIAVGDIQSLVRHLTNRGIGVLITDHNVRETLGLTDRAYIIYSGEVLMEGRADDIVNNPEVRRLYLGEEFRL